MKTQVSRRIRALCFLPLFPMVLALTGCYFAHGLKVEPHAYVRIDPNNSGRLIVVLRAEQWHTGNAHVPLDFTVYRYERWYEVRIPNTRGNIKLDEIQLFACGRKIDEIFGTLSVSEDRLRLDLQYSISPTGKVTERVNSDVKLLSEPGPPSRCS